MRRWRTQRAARWLRAVALVWLALVLGDVVDTRCHPPLLDTSAPILTAAAEIDIPDGCAINCVPDCLCCAPPPPALAPTTIEPVFRITSSVALCKPQLIVASPPSPFHPPRTVSL